MVSGLIKGPGPPYVSKKLCALEFNIFAYITKEYEFEVTLEWHNRIIV